MRTKTLYSERDIQNQIISYLWMKGYYVQRLNSGKMAYTNTRGRKSMMQLCAPGTPDIMAFKIIENPLSSGRFSTVDLLFVEVKRPGNKVTILQEAKMKELEGYGARCKVATSIEDIEAVI